MIKPLHLSWIWAVAILFASTSPVSADDREEEERRRIEVQVAEARAAAKAARAKKGEKGKKAQWANKATEAEEIQRIKAAEAEARERKTKRAADRLRRLDEQERQIREMMMRQPGTHIPLQKILDRMHQKRQEHEKILGIGPGAGDPDALNVKRIKQLALALRTYAEDADGKLPAALQVLVDKEYVKQAESLQWTHPRTRHTFTFLYRAGADVATEAPDEVMVAAAPFAFKGKRQVLFGDWHMERVSENVFKENAVKARWDISILSGDEKVRLAKLITRLGAEKYSDRKAAKAALKEIGDAAVPALTEALEHPDPEIRPGDPGECPPTSEAQTG